MKLALVGLVLALLPGCAGALYVSQSVETAQGDETVIVLRSCRAVGAWALGLGTVAGCAEGLGVEPAGPGSDGSPAPTAVREAREVAGVHGGPLTERGAQAAGGVLGLLRAAVSVVVPGL